MPTSTFKFDFRDVEKSFRAFNRQVRRKVEAIGQESVEYAKEHGDYHDVTGKCRSSNKYAVDSRNNLEVYNDCGYADALESRGREVISSAALFAEKRLKEEFE